MKGKTVNKSKAVKIDVEAERLHAERVRQLAKEGTLRMFANKSKPAATSESYIRPISPTPPVSVREGIERMFGPQEPKPSPSGEITEGVLDALEADWAKRLSDLEAELTKQNAAMLSEMRRTSAEIIARERAKLAKAS